MKMYDTELAQETVRIRRERSVRSWMRAAACAAGGEANTDLWFVQPECAPMVEVDIEQAVERKKRDNLALGEALVSIGLLGHGERAGMERAQAEGSDIVASLMVASALRSRLGEMLLQAKQITSCQLEFALEVQRHQGGLLGEILVSLGWLDVATLDAALAAQLGCNAT